MRRIAVLAQRPVPGQVLPGLPPSLPATLACELYRGLLADVLDAVAATPADERFVYWDRADGPAITPPAGFVERVWSVSDESAARAAALAELSAGGETRALVVHADGFELTRDRIEAALDSGQTTLRLGQISVPDDVAKLVARLSLDEHAAGPHTRSALRAIGMLG